jgi:hypothetical protein
MKMATKENVDTIEVDIGKINDSLNFYLIKKTFF